MKVHAALTGILAALGACSSSHPIGGTGGAGATGGGGGTNATTIELSPTVDRNVDVLFMVDDSAGMTINQQKLLTSFHAYVDVLAALPGGLPNLHLGVVSSSMGAGRNPSIDDCPPGGDQGILQAKPLGATCATAALDAGQNFIINNGGQTNYTGELADVFGCIAALGSRGCGFEHQLESVMRALGADGAAAPPQNADFLRPDAFLQIVLVTDEDDCSAPPDSDLFDSTSQLVSDPLGPLQSYRCNEYGHLCGGKPPPRTMAADLSGTCVSAEDGRLIRVADAVTALKRLKADPNKVLVAAIAAPPNPYVVALGPPAIASDPSMWPYVQHSCMAADGTFGDPAVRIDQAVKAFGANGLFEEICNDSMAPALTAIATQVAKVFGAPCLDAAVDPSTCTAVDHGFDAAGDVVDAPLVQCASNGDQPPCLDIGAPGSCPSGRALSIMRAGPPTELSATLTCAK